MQSRLAERTCVLALLAYLVWIPMPFGSVVDAAQPPLILAPLIICAAAALLRSRATNVARPTAPYRIWTTGAVVFALIAAFQLVELPDGLLRVLSPESFAIWSAASRVSALLLQSAPPAEHPITVDPAATWLQLFRFLAYVATFQASAILIRNHLRRIALAATLGATALFEVLYGVREAALQRYAIWGWKNTKIYNRVTGTFVNPNHFAHYAAIVLPIGVYLAALAWREAAPSGVPVRRRLARLVEKRFLMFAGGATVSLACIVAVLVAQSRGALLAIAAAFAAAGALSLRPSHHRRHSRGVAFAKFALAFAATALVVGGLIALLGTERTVARFKPTETEQTNFVGRRDEIAAAVAVWKRFPLFGSGLGTFEHVVTLVQSKDLHVTYNHAHDDYAEIAATTGLAGFSVAIVAIVLGYVALVRLSRARSMSSRRRGFLIAALCSILVALVHALIDFNFFIPANPATLAAIAGAAVATRSVRDAESGSASSDSRVAAQPGALPPES